MAERESVVVSVSATGVRVVRRDIESIGRASDRTESSVQLLRRGLGALFGLFAANQIKETLDSFTTMQNRIRALGNSVQTTTAIYNELLKSAMDSRTSLAASVTMYQRLAQSTEQLGISQRDVIEITDTLNKAVIVSGAGAIEARNAMIQLAQGMASGRLQGDELRSVLEQLPYVARLISRQTGIEFGNLRDAAAEGKITVDQIVAALKNYRGEVLAAFATTTPTIEQSLANLNTAWTDYAGKLGQATGVTNAIANSILFVANNMQTLIPIAISAGVAVAGAFTPQLVGVLAAVNGQLVRMVTLLAANPLVALAGAAAALTTYLVLMRDELKLGNDEITTLGDAFGPMWRDAQQGALDLVNVLDSGPIPGLKRVQEAIDDITFLDILVSLANTTDELIRTWGGVLAVMDTLWTRFVAALGPRLIDQLNPALQGLSDVFNYEPPWFKKIRELAGLEESKQFFDFTIDLPTPEDMANSGRDLGEAFRSGYNLAAVDNGNPAADYIAGIVDEASVNSQLRMFQNVTNKLFSGLDKPGKGGGNNEVSKELQKSQDKARKDYNKTLALRRQLQNQLSADAGSNNLDVVGVGMGDKQIDRMRKVYEIQQDYLQRQQRLFEQYNSGDITRQQYESQYQTIEEFSTKAVAQQRQMYREIDNAQGDWLNGARSAFQNYLTDVADVAGQTEDIFTDGFKGAEDALVNFVTTGKAQFSDLVNSIAEDLIRLQVRQSITGPLSSALSSAFGFGGVPGGISGPGAYSTSSGDFLSNTQFSEGGYTGEGGRLEPAGIVHKREFVVKSSVVSQPGVRPMLEQLNRGGSGGGGSSPAPASSGREKMTFVIRNEGEPQRIESVQETRSADGQRQFDIMLKTSFESGSVDSPMRNRFGVKRRPVGG